MSKYQIRVSKTFKTQRKKMSKSDLAFIDEVVIKLACGEILAPHYKDHKLTGDYKDFRECHVKPNLLLIYRIYDKILELYLAQIGSHSELFKK